MSTMQYFCVLNPNSHHRMIMVRKSNVGTWNLFLSSLLSSSTRITHSQKKRPQPHSPHDSSLWSLQFPQENNAADTEPNTLSLTPQPTKSKSAANNLVLQPSGRAFGHDLHLFNVADLSRSDFEQLVFVKQLTPVIPIVFFLLLAYWPGHCSPQ